MNDMIDEIIITSEKNIQGYNYQEENGSGYVYPIRNNGLEVNVNVKVKEGGEEYKIEGKCSCCFECMENENCGNEYCVNNYCVECKNDENCKNKNENMVCGGGGKCIVEGECKNDNDCMIMSNKENKMLICTDDGYCKKGCRYDNHCDSMNKEICDYYGNCVKGCRNNDDCSNDKMCFEGKCKENGCINNFDCGEYNTVCIDNQCISTETSYNCVEDNDCESDYYCNYEYLICVNRIETSIIHRKNSEMLPAAVCTIYGIISLFVMTTSYTIASKISNEQIVDACNRRCSEMYFSTTDVKVSDVKVTETNVKKKKLQNSECTGYCKAKEWVYNRNDANSFARKNCRELTLTSTISANEQRMLLNWKSRESDNLSEILFRAQLRTFCQHTVPEFFVESVKLCRGKYRFVKPCLADEESVKCNDV